jgi:nitroreductase
MTTLNTSPALDALERLLDRRSCRGFLPEPLPQATITTILALAQRTPSWCNTQPWDLTITRGDGTRRVVDAMLGAGDEEPEIAFPASYNGVYRERRREAARRLYEAVGVEWGDREASAREANKNFELFGAPHLAVLTTGADLGTYGAIDCGLYLESFLLAAEALGVATIPQAAIAMRSKTLRDVLGLADDRLVLCGISFGFPDPSHASAGVRTDRADLTDVVTFFD